MFHKHYFVMWRRNYRRSLVALSGHHKRMFESQNQRDDENRRDVAGVKEGR
jgi:hypothetical protein